MAAHKITEFTKNLVREQYEAGETFAQIARNFGISTATVKRYAEIGEWLRPDERAVKNAEAPPGAAAEAAMLDDDVPDLPVQTVVKSEGPTDPDLLPEPPALDEANLREALAEIERLEAENAELQARVDEMKSTADVELYETPEQVVEILGEDLLRETAKMKLRLQNRRDALRGLASPINFDDPAFESMVENQVHLEVQQAISQRTSHISPLKVLRVVKMVRPTPGPDGRRSIVQIPMEEQINNMKGEQSAPMAKARAKGFQLAEPYLCQRLDCWLPVPRDPVSKKLANDGYCSMEHRAVDPYLGGTPVPGVTTTKQRGLSDWTVR